MHRPDQVPDGGKPWVGCVDAIGALGSANLATVEVWGQVHYPNDPLGNARVASPSHT